MKTTVLKRLRAVNLCLNQTIFSSNALKIAASLFVVLWLNSCNCDDINNPGPPSRDFKLAQKIDSVWSKSMIGDTIPGMSVVIIKNGKTFFQKGYGYADVKSKTPVTNETLFAIGSTTKAMTAFAVLSLVDKGLLKLEEKVTTYLPDFVMKDSRYKDITVDQLLSHSSGLRTFSVLSPPDDSPTAIESILEILKDEELEFAPGEGFYYSNYGTTLAGLLIQRVSKMPYEGYMQQSLFAKVGMKNTSLAYWEPNALRGTKGYVLNSMKQLEETAPYFNRLYSPAGAATITNSNDVALYLKMLVNGTTTQRGEKLLSDSLVHGLFKGTVNANDDDYIKYIKASATYGYGWYNINRSGFVTIEHSGNIGSMLSSFIVDPTTKSAVGILVNRQDFTKLDVAAEVAQMVFTAQ